MIGIVLLTAMITSAIFTWLGLRWALTSPWLCGLFASGGRAYTPKSHQKKKGTPVFGGIVIVGVSLVCSIVAGGYILAFYRGGETLEYALIPTLLWWGMILVMAGLGLCDDWLKRVQRGSGGLSMRAKLLFQFPACGLFLFLVVAMTRETQWDFLFFSWVLPLGSVGFLFIGVLWAVFMVNAVNLCDGIDGLAASNGITLLLSTMVLVIGIPFIESDPSPLHQVLSLGDMLFHAPQGWTPVEISLVMVSMASVIGSFAGFWLLNRSPARVFMGDTGSLALGGACVASAVILAYELMITMMAVVFVAEGLSVVIQIVAVRGFGRRVFRISPLHHHYETGGWSEIHIVRRFLLVSVVASVMTLAYVAGSS